MIYNLNLLLIYLILHLFTDISSSQGGVGNINLKYHKYLLLILHFIPDMSYPQEGVANEYLWVWFTLIIILFTFMSYFSILKNTIFLFKPSFY